MIPLRFFTTSYPEANNPYPGIDTDFITEDNASAAGTRVEQQAGQASRTFLYGRGDSYIAYMDADTRPDDDFDDDSSETVLVASGDPGYEVTVKCENQYVRFSR